MTIARSDIGNLLRLGINTVFGLQYRDIPLERDMVFESRTSNQAYEEDQLMTGTGWAVVKGEGQRITFDRMREGWTARYDHATIALGLRITEEAMEDNLYFKFGAKGGRSLARSLRLTQDVRAINVLNNAVSTSHLGGDGKPLLATDHPLSGLAGGSYANTLATQMDISEAALEELLILCRYAVDDRGLAINLTPKRLIASASLTFELTRLLKSQGRVGTGDNDTNALKAQGMFQDEPALLRHLTDEDFWGFTTTGHDGGLIHYTRRGIQQKDNADFDTGDYEMKVSCRDSAGWTDPRGFYGCSPNGATS